MVPSRCRHTAVKIVVRSSKDRNAVRYAIDKFYGGDPAIDVLTLGGARRCDDILEKLKELSSSMNDIYLVLLGEESIECKSLLLRELELNVYVHFVPRKKVRNLRIEHLAWEIAKAKSLARLSVGWVPNEQCYAFYKTKLSKPLIDKPDPGYDVFLLWGRGRCLLNEVIGVDCSLPLLIRMYGGEHLVFCGDVEVGKISIPDDFRDVIFEKRFESSPPTPSLSNTLERNLELTKLIVRRAEELLQSFSKGFNKIIVPLSGGKDSALCLSIAVKVFGSESVTAVYVDTGLEFPQTREYVEMLSAELGVNLLVLRAPLRNEIVKRARFPSHSDRWCTQLKVGTLEKFIRSFNGKKLVIVGDRDAESRSRSWRPTVRDEGDVRYIAPIKPWSTAHIQISLFNLGIPINPLYELGFYRIGCFVCPSLRSWERKIMARHPDTFREVLNDPLFKEFDEAKRSVASMQR